MYSSWSWSNTGVLFIGENPIAGIPSYFHAKKKKKIEENMKIIIKR